MPKIAWPALGISMDMSFFKVKHCSHAFHQGTYFSMLAEILHYKAK